MPTASWLIAVPSPLERAKKARSGHGDSGTSAKDVLEAALVENEMASFMIEHYVHCDGSLPGLRCDADSPNFNHLVSALRTAASNPGRIRLSF
jgi:hypothetical protein